MYLNYLHAMQHTANSINFKHGPVLWQALSNFPLERAEANIIVDPFLLTCGSELDRADDCSLVADRNFLDSSASLPKVI